MPGEAMTMRLVDALYTDAMLLADEARDYFDVRGRADRDRLEPLVRVTFTCESLKVTTRLMHIIAWLLTRRAVEAGEISRHEARDPARRLGVVAGAEPSALAALPDTARALVEASDELYRRVRRLDRGLDQAATMPGPARGLFARLESVF